MNPSTNDEIRTAVMMGMLAMIVMAIFVIVFVISYQKKQIAQQKHLRDLENQHQKLLLDTALNTEEAERRRIAQDLHDDIGTMLSLTKFSLNQVAVDPAGQESPLSKVKSLLDETIVHVRRITSDLVPTTLERFGLSAAIEEFLNKVRGSNSIKVLFGCEPAQPPRLTQKVELSLFRVVQELVNNAVKHSACDQIEIMLSYSEAEVDLLVADNGRGFNEKEMRLSPDAGHGLRNIESRVSIIDGTIAYDTSPGAGCKARVLLKLDGQTAMS